MSVGRVLSPETSVSDTNPEFDDLSRGYEDLLKDPLRDRFAGDNTQYFHVRKRDLLRRFFRRRRIDTSKLSFLDLGCGKGELLKLLCGDFRECFGCDPSSGMLEASELNAIGVQTRVQHNPQSLPFENAQFDFISAVCVYHHVTPDLRASLTAEVRRVLRPGGWFVIIEHNPYNPATRIIVSRTPVDANAILLRPAEGRRLMRDAGFQVDAQQYFLYFPERLYNYFGGFEPVLAGVPLGGQYAVFGDATEGIS